MLFRSFISELNFCWHCNWRHCRDVACNVSTLWVVATTMAVATAVLAVLSIIVLKNTKNKMGKYKNKYRIESARLQTWDYSWSAAYFITICTKKHFHYFGKIELLAIGVIANYQQNRQQRQRIDVACNVYTAMQQNKK